MTERTLRPSSLSGFADCNRRWAARHMRAEVQAAGYDLAPPQPSNCGALVGSGVHAGAAYTLATMQASGALGRAEDAEEQAIAGFRDRMEAEGASWDEVTDKPNTAERQIRRMLRSYREEVAPQVRPLLIEERAEAEIAPGWIISGQADALAEDATEPMAQVIRDLKTGRRQRANAPQYALYEMLLRAHGHNPHKLVEDYIARVPLREAQPQAESHVIDRVTGAQDAWTILRAIMRDAAEWDRRIADPNGEDPRAAWLPNPSSSLCSAKWCSAWGTRFCTSHRR